MANEYWSIAFPSEDFERANAIANEFIAQGNNTNDDWVKARGIVRVAFNDLNYGKWTPDGFDPYIERARKLVGESADDQLTTEQSVARAEVLLLHGFCKAFWLRKPVGTDLDRALILAYRSGDVSLLSAAYQLAARIERLRGYNLLSLEYALKSKSFAQMSGNAMLLMFANQAVVLGFSHTESLNSDAAISVINDLEKSPAPLPSTIQRALTWAKNQTATPDEIEVRVRENRTKCDLWTDARILDADDPTKQAFFNDAMFVVVHENDSNRFESSERLLPLVARISEQLQDQFAINYVTMLQACVLAKTGKLAQSIDFAEPIFEELVQSQPSLAFEMATVVSQAAFHKGDLDLANSWFDRAIILAREHIRMQIPAVLKNHELSMEQHRLTTKARADENKMSSKLFDARNAQQKWTLIGIASLFLGIVGFIGQRWFNSSRMQKRLDAQVKQRTKELLASKVLADEANQSKSLFFAQMNHELRNPLSSIFMLSELLEHGVGQSEETIKQLRNNTGRLLSIVDQLLEATRLEHTRLTHLNRQFAPKELLSCAIERAYTRIESAGKKVAIEVACDESTILVGDAGKIQQILLNLVDNAAKFTNTGQIHLSAWLTQFEGDTASLNFKIEDSGVGIAKEQEAKLFEPWQTSNKKIAANQGSGLGLSICKMLVEFLQGSIELDSIPGKGTVFQLQFPIKVAPSRVQEIGRNT